PAMLSWVLFWLRLASHTKRVRSIASARASRTTTGLNWFLFKASITWIMASYTGFCLMTTANRFCSDCRPARRVDTAWSCELRLEYQKYPPAAVSRRSSRCRIGNAPVGAEAFLTFVVAVGCAPFFDAPPKFTRIIGQTPLVQG